MTDKIEALERLARLKTDGMLSDEEFASQKAAVLDQSSLHVPGGASPKPTIGERWREARAQSRGVRHFLRWFWLAQLVIIALIGIYFLTRGGTQDAHQATLEPATTTSVSPPSLPPPTSMSMSTKVGTNNPENTDTVEITDAVLANPWNYDGDGGEGSTRDVCAAGSAIIHNHSTQALHLQIGSLYTGAMIAALGEVKPGAEVSARMAGVGQFVVGKTIEGGAIPLFLLNVVNCHHDED